MTTPLSVALGGGGFFGIGWLLGVVDSLADLDVRLDNSPLLGTSAGSWVASCIVCDIGIDRFVDLEPPDLPAPRRGVLYELAAEVFGDARDERVSAGAVEIPRMRRRLLQGGRVELAHCVAASAAVPGVFAPHRIGRRDYVDGGVRSPVSADLAAPARHLLVAAPIAGRVFGPAGRATDRWALREQARWRRAWGGRTTFIRPGRQAASVVGSTPLSLFDKDRAMRAYEAARIEVTRVLHGPLAEDLELLRRASAEAAASPMQGEARLVVNA